MWRIAQLPTSSAYHFFPTTESDFSPCRQYLQGVAFRACRIDDVLVIARWPDIYSIRYDAAVRMRQRHTSLENCCWRGGGIRHHKPDIARHHRQRRLSDEMNMIFVDALRQKGPH